MPMANVNGTMIGHPVAFDHRSTQTVRYSVAKRAREREREGEGGVRGGEIGKRESCVK